MYRLEDGTWKKQVDALECNPGSRSSRDIFSNDYPEQQIAS
jgi:hypothetical protein